jgi:hypothetical protein
MTCAKDMIGARERLLYAICVMARAYKAIHHTRAYHISVPYTHAIR